jgi:hypothetical protein
MTFGCRCLAADSQYESPFLFYAISATAEYADARPASLLSEGGI